MPVDTTLLDLDRVPTLDELKAFFKKHDWSAAKISEPQSRDTNKIAEMNEIKKIMDAEFENLPMKKVWVRRQNILKIKSESKARAGMFLKIKAIRFLNCATARKIWYPMPYMKLWSITRISLMPFSAGSTLPIQILSRKPMRFYITPSEPCST